MNERRPILELIGNLGYAVSVHRVNGVVVYRDVPIVGDPPLISEEYVARAKPVVDEQIQRAGVRLAAALNLALRWRAGRTAGRKVEPWPPGSDTARRSRTPS